MRNKIRIKLLTFFRTGKFASVGASVSKNWLDRHFIKVTDKTYMGNKLSIWRYGVIEFHFDGDYLFQIWCDNLHYLKSNRWFILDKWILTHPKRLTFEYVITHIEQENIAYEVEERPEYNNRIIHLHPSKVRLFFEDSEMVAFCLQYSDVSKWIRRS